MGLLDRVFGRREYALKARKNGAWEEIEIFDRKVSVSDVQHVIEDLREDGYDYVILYDKTVKRTVWAKKLKPTKTPTDIINEQIQSVARLIEAIEKIRGKNEMTFEQVVSSILYYEKLKQMIASTTSSGGDQFLNVLANVIGLALASKGLKGLQAPQQPQLQPQAQQPIQQAQPVPSNSQPLMPVYSENTDFEKLPEEVQKAYNETVEQIEGMPCPAEEFGEKCEER